MLGGAGILLAAGPAHAAEVAFATECIPPSISGLPPVEGTTKVEITAPATAKVGDEVDVVWKTTQAASSNPDVLDLEKDTVLPTGTVKVAGAQTADLAVTGTRTNPAIPKKSPMVLSDMKGKLKLTTAGDVTLTADKYNINVSKPISTDTKCSPKETVKSSVTIKVTAGGGTTGGTTGGGTTGGGTTGGTTAGGTTGGDTTGGGTTGGTTAGGTTAGSTTGGGSGGATDFPGKTVTTGFACTSPGPAKIDGTATINAKANGGSYDLTVTTGKGVMNSPAPLPAGALKPSMVIKIGGADSGSVKVVGAANKAALNTGDPVSLEDMTGTYKPVADGKATLSPGDLTIVVKLSPTADPITIPCRATKTGVSLTLDVTKQAGGVSGATTAGSSGGGTAAGTSSGTDGGLAATGAEDHGALKALGLVAGTVILLGGAVFTFTPWRRLRGMR